MDPVHWWALGGLVCFIGGTALLVRSHAEAQSAAEDRILISKQLEMMLEAIELSKYGAQAEAIELIDEAARLKPQWNIEEYRRRDAE